MKTIIIFIFIALGMLACATPQHLLVSRLKVGMDKTQVLDILGSPNHSRFNNGLHEWVYVFDGPAQERQGKKLYFKRGDLIRINDYDFNEDIDKQIKSADTMKEYEQSVQKKRQDSEAGFKNLDD